MSRLDRLKEYANPQRGRHGAASDKSNFDFWINRATENSQIAPRAKGPVHGGPPGTYGEDAPALPSTKVTGRATAMRPKVSRSVDALMRGRDDLNHVGGSDYMKSVRRDG